MIKFPLLKILKLFIILILINTTLFGQNLQHFLNEQWLQKQKEIAAVTVLLNNKQGDIPIKNLNQKIASVNIGTSNAVTFDSLLNKYTNVDSFSIDTTNSAFNEAGIDLKFYNTVIVQIKASGLTQNGLLSFLYDIQKSKHLILVIYGNRNSLTYATLITNPIIITDNDSPTAANLVAQLIFGGVSASSKLQASYSKKYQKENGAVTKKIRIKYSVAEDAGINIVDIDGSIDSLVTDAILKKAIPGAVVMVLKDGKVIFNKAYGAHTYEQTKITKISDLFDMASVTKVSASTMAIMRLYEQHKIELDSSFGYYFPPARNSNKSMLKIKDLLLHQSGLAPGVILPLLPADVSSDSSADYPVKGGNKVFISKNYFKKVIMPRMLNVAVDSPKYVYSDLSMTYMKEVIENESATKLDDYLMEQFYTPLGMQSAGFNPLRRFDSSRIVPTERDADFRKGLIHGYVHDPMAAKYGGVSGNAGLFASTNDLAILYQMILNKGTYGGKQYFKPQTINLFTSSQSAISRRGLGFDRTDTTIEAGYPSKLAPPETYGHTGFTGTSFWVDPINNMVFIFFSNRVYPTATSTIYKLHTQGNIMDVFYKAIMKHPSF